VGYADGLLRRVAPVLQARAGNRVLPVIGRISMDLLAIDVSASDAGEGDWIDLPLDLPDLAAASGLSQYEILTGLGERFDRRWT
jgi:alanine racemase